MTTTNARPDPDVASPPSSVPRTPAARRLQPPRWQDRRLLLGVAAVLLAVLLGARLAATRNQTSAVLTAAHPLAAGHVLGPGDLAVGHVRLGAAGTRYWPAADATGLGGHPLLTAVAVGDLLPRSAVGTTASPVPTRLVSLPVEPARVPPLAAGDLVDVFATTKPTGAAPGQTVAILRGAEFVGGGDTGSAGSVTIRLRVPVAVAAALVSASETASLDLVLQQPAGDDAGDVGIEPVPAPGPAAATGPAAAATSPAAPR